MIAWGDGAAAFDNNLPQDLTVTDIDLEGELNHHPFFYYRNKATMIEKWIEELLDEASTKVFFNKNKYFTWTNAATGIDELDGSTMLQLVVQSINPTTRVGVSDLKREI